jgi:hypothetical protein
MTPFELVEPATLGEALWISWVPEALSSISTSVALNMVDERACRSRD